MNRNTRRAVAMVKEQRTLQFVDETGPYPDPKLVTEFVDRMLKNPEAKVVVHQTKPHNGEFFPGLKRGKYEVRNDLENKVCGHVHKTFWSALGCMLKLDSNRWKVVNLKQRRK